MLKNQIIRIILCGLTVTNMTLAMDKESTTLATSTQPLSRQSGRQSRSPRKDKTLHNGYYTNNISFLPANLPVYTYQKEKGLPRGASKITYENAQTNKVETVRFSGRNYLNELLTYNNEKYHVIVDDQLKAMFAIKMNSAESTESQSQSPETSSEETVQKGRELLKNKFGSSSNSDNEKEKNSVVYEPILDNMGDTYRGPGESNRDTIVGFFTNNEFDYPCYDCVNRKETIDGSSEITYKQDNGTPKTITIKLPKYSGNKYIVVTENIMGLISKYVIRITEPNNNIQPSQQGQLFGKLYAMPLNCIPNDIKDIYDGSITKFDFHTYEITYTDKNQIHQVVYVTATKSNPTFAIITDKQNESQCAIKLPVQETKNTKSPSHKDAFTPNGKKPHNGYGLKHAIMGAAFIAFCVALARKYDKLPDAFAQLIDNIIAQCINAIPSSFAR